MDRYTYEQLDKIEEVVLHLMEQQERILEILENQKGINELKQKTKREV